MCGSKLYIGTETTIATIEVIDEDVPFSSLRYPGFPHLLRRERTVRRRKLLAARTSGRANGQRRAKRGQGASLSPGLVQPTE